jgi:hypothetical protein
MLNNSTDLTMAAWQADPLLSVTPGAADPLGGTTAFTILNSGQVDQKISQQMAAPAGFQYCLSVYACAQVATSIELGVSAVSSQSQSFPIGASWTRLINSTKLPDSQLGFTVSITIPAAQTVVVWGPQLEPQLSPSRYRPTAASGGVYQNAHLLGDSITFESESSGLFSTLVTIETT